MSDDTITLSTLRQEADAALPPVKLILEDGTEAGIEVTLPHLLRLPQRTRDTITAQLADLDTTDAATTDVNEISRRAHIGTAILKAVAGDQGEQLTQAINGDAVIIGKLIDKWRPAKATD